MNTVLLSVASRDDVTQRALAAFGEQAQGGHIAFASAELLWQTLSWLWQSIVSLAGSHEAGYLENCRQYPLAA